MSRRRQTATPIDRYCLLYPTSGAYPLAAQAARRASLTLTLTQGHTLDRCTRRQPRTRPAMSGLLRSHAGTLVDLAIRPGRATSYLRNAIPGVTRPTRLCMRAACRHGIDSWVVAHSAIRSGSTRSRTSGLRSAAGIRLTRAPRMSSRSASRRLRPNRLSPAGSRRAGPRHYRGGLRRRLRCRRRAAWLPHAMLRRPDPPGGGAPGGPRAPTAGAGGPVATASPVSAQ